MYVDKEENADKGVIQYDKVTESLKHSSLDYTGSINSKVPYLPNAAEGIPEDLYRLDTFSSGIDRSQQSKGYGMSNFKYYLVK